MRVLVTGGAGYVGGVSVEAFLAAGHEVVVLDDLTTGHRGGVLPAALPRPAAPYGGRGGVAAPARARAASTRSSTAPPARSSARVDRDPAKYYRDNVAGGIALLEAARDGRRRAAIVFCSTAAVYGVPDATPIPEDAPLRADQPVRRDEADVRGRAALVRRAPTGCGAVILRYFNVAGATERARRGPRPGDAPHPQRPARGRGRSAADALRRRLPDARRHAASATTSTSPTWPTRTCARSRRRPRRPAHRPARPAEPLICNLGTASGFSVREVLAAADGSSASAIPHTVGPRRGRRSAGPRGVQRAGARGPGLDAAPADPAPR